MKIGLFSKKNCAYISDQSGPYFDCILWKEPYFDWLFAQETLIVFFRRSPILIGNLSKSPMLCRLLVLRGDRVRAQVWHSRETMAYMLQKSPILIGNLSKSPMLCRLWCCVGTKFVCRCGTRERQWLTCCKRALFWQGSHVKETRPWREHTHRYNHMKIPTDMHQKFLKWPHVDDDSLIWIHDMCIMIV